MKRFDEVILRLCEVYKARQCSVLSIKGNVIKVQSHSTTFYDNLAYFEAVCECYMEAYCGATAWIISIDTEEHIIELGYNY